MLYVPENEKLAELEYGAHWSRPDRGQSGWYVRIGEGPWVQARGTPAADELPDDYEAAYWEAAEENAE